MQGAAVVFRNRDEPNLRCVLKLRFQPLNGVAQCEFLRLGDLQLFPELRVPLQNVGPVYL
jgi:hypothetical protein